MDKLVKLFKALSDTNRVRILKMLEVRPLCVCEITETLQLATSTVSKHLSVLRDSGLITDQKDGKWVNYNLSLDQNNEYVRHMLPLLRGWLPNEKTIKSDHQKVKQVDRNKLCHT